MKTLTGAALFLALFVVTDWVPQPRDIEAAPIVSGAIVPADDQDLKTKIDTLIQQLDNDSIVVRDAAAVQLIAGAKQDLTTFNLTKQELQAVLLGPPAPSAELGARARSILATLERLAAQFLSPITVSLREDSEATPTLPPSFGTLLPGGRGFILTFSGIRWTAEGDVWLCDPSSRENCPGDPNKEPADIDPRDLLNLPDSDLTGLSDLVRFSNASDGAKVFFISDNEGRLDLTDAPSILQKSFVEFKTEVSDQTFTVVLPFSPTILNRHKFLVDIFSFQAPPGGRDGPESDRLTLQAVPFPGTLFLVSIGILGLALGMKRNG